jgi:small-conductance mechanosensitive channel
MESEPECLDDLVCRWLWELSDRTWIAEGGQAALTGIRIFGILVGAVILRWLASRVIKRMVRRAASDEVPTLLKPVPAKLLNSMREGAGISRLRRTQRAEAIGSVLRSAATVAIFTVAFLIILGELDIELAPLIAGAGIVGVALGFGAQTLVRDVLAGLFILLEDQYGVGDVVDLGEASGVVQGIGLRVTTLRDLQGVIWYVPNGEIQRVGNRSHHPATVVVDIPIGFVPVPRAAEALRRGADRLVADTELGPDLVEPPELLGIERVTVEGAVFRTIVKTTADSQWQIGRELRRAQTEELEAAGFAEQIIAARAYPRDQGDGEAQRSERQG